MDLTKMLKSLRRTFRIIGGNSFFKKLTTPVEPTWVFWKKSSAFPFGKVRENQRRYTNKGHFLELRKIKP